MARTTRKQLESLVSIFAAVTNRPNLVLDITNPGDGTRYRVEELVLPSYGHAQPWTLRSYTAGELWEVLHGTLRGIELALGQDEYNKRLQAHYQKNDN